MTDQTRTQIKAYLYSKCGELVHFKAFNTNISVDGILEEILTIKKDIIRIHMDRNYGKRDYYSI